MNIDLRSELSRLARLLYKQYNNRTFMLSTMEESLNSNIRLKRSTRGPLHIIKSKNSLRDFTRLVELNNHTFISYLGPDLLYLVDEVLRRYNMDKEFKKYICNELYNIMNYGNISIKSRLRNPKTFDKITKFLNRIANDVRKTINIEKHMLNSNELFLATMYDDMNWSHREQDYYVVYIKPLVSYANTHKQPKDFTLQPVIVNDELDIVYNRKLNDTLLDISDRYDVTLYMRCLVPKSFIMKIDGLQKTIDSKHIVFNNIREPKFNHKDISILRKELCNRIEVDKGIFSNTEFSSKEDYILLRPYWKMNINTMLHIFKK